MPVVSRLVVVGDMSGTVIIAQKDLWSLPTVTVNGALTMPSLPNIPVLPGLPFPIYSGIHAPRVEFQTVAAELQSFNTVLVMKKMTDILFGIIPTSWPTIPNLSFSFPDILSGNPTGMIAEIKTAISNGGTFAGVPKPFYTTTISPVMEATHTYMLIVRNYLQTIANLIISVINQVIGKLSALQLPGLPTIPTIPSPDAVLSMLKNEVASAMASAESSVANAITTAQAAIAVAQSKVASMTAAAESALAASGNAASASVQQAHAVSAAYKALSDAQAEYASAQKAYSSAQLSFKVPSIPSIASLIPTKFGFPSIPFPDPFMPTMSHVDHEVMVALDSIQTSYSAFVMKLVAGWNGWNLIGGLPLPSPLSITIPF